MLNDWLWLIQVQLLFSLKIESCNNKASIKYELRYLKMPIEIGGP